MEPLKPKTGSPAEGDGYFFYRESVINKIHEKINNKENILISAPRRIGKSSILKYLANNPKDNQIIKYMIVQSADSGDNFYKKVLNALIIDNEIYKLTEQLIKKLSLSVRAYVSKVTGINTKGMKLSENEKLNYYELVSRILLELSKHEKQIILIFDEFPDAVANILAYSKQGAISFLQQHREFRELYSDSSLLFIYTGSTGLKNVVRKIGHSHLINNLVEIKMPPMRYDEALEFIQRLVLYRQKKIPDFILSKVVIDYIIQKITWLLPYYIQIIIEEIYDGFNQKEINKNSVDKAIETILKYDSSYSEYFENWHSRLKTAFGHKEDYKLAINILNTIAIQDVIKKSQFHDLKVKYKNADGKYVEDVLRFDGYIDYDKATKSYGFNSFLLKQWWYINVAT